MFAESRTSFARPVRFYSPLSGRLQGRAAPARGHLRVCRVVVVLILTLAAGCGKGRHGDKEAAPDSAPPAAQRSAHPSLAAVQVERLWRTPVAGAVRALRVVGDRVVVTARRRGDRSSVRRLVAFALSNGGIRWKRASRVRLFERNAPWTHSVAVVGTTLAVAKTANRVQALDCRTGASRWRTRGSGGVARVGQRFAVADAARVTLVAPETGKAIRFVDLGTRASGAPGNGLMDRLMPGTRLAPVAGGVVLMRRHGGAVQALSATLAARWRYLPPDAQPSRPDRLISGGGTLLVPVMRPRRMERTRVEIWPASARKPALEAVVPGRVSRRRFWITPEAVIGLSRTSTRQTLLYRVDRRTGTLLDARPFPAPHFCFLGHGILACKRRRAVSGHRIDTLARVWRYAPPMGRNIRSVRRAGDWLVLEVGRDLVVRTLQQGISVLQVHRTLEGKPYRVDAALGVQGDALVLAVRHQEGSPWGDRLLLVGLSVKTGKPVYVRPLGRYPRPGVLPSGPVREDAEQGKLPVVWAPGTDRSAPGRVVSLFGKVFQVVDARTGRVVFARGIPGQAGHRARLVQQGQGVAVFRRGRRLFGVTLATHRVAWQASLRRVRKELVTPARVYVSQRQGRRRLMRALPPRAPDPEAGALGAASRLGCRPLWVAAGTWFCQGGGKLRILDVAGTVVRAGPPATNVFPSPAGVVLTFPERVRTTRQSSWVGIALETGAVRFEVPAAADGAGLPAPFAHETARPARVLGFGAGAFWVSGPEGRCLHGIDAATGAARPRLCFDGLAEPPLPWRRWLLVTAPAHGGAGSGAPRWVLYAVDPRSGAQRVLYRPGPGKRVVLGDAGVVPGPGGQGDLLVVTERPIKGAYRDNAVVALRLR